MSGRCATCKHWVSFDERQTYDYEPDVSDAEDARIFISRRRLGLCRKADGINIDPTTLAIAQDGSDYKANFRTAATFGCVMHEAKS